MGKREVTCLKLQQLSVFTDSVIKYFAYLNSSSLYNNPFSLSFFTLYYSLYSTFTTHLTDENLNLKGNLHNVTQVLDHIKLSLSHFNKKNTTYSVSCCLSTPHHQ